MEAIANLLQDTIFNLQQHALFALKLIGLLWLLQIINWSLGYRLNALGIRPRTLSGLLGIIFSPFLHGGFGHLFLNTIPLFALGCLILVNGQETFYTVSIIIIVLGGFATWLFGRRATHVGSSILIMGYFGYLLANSYYHFNASTVILAIICVYYFGGLISALVPDKREISWESHIFGFIAGIVAAYIYPMIPSVLQLIQVNLR
jgi:membrane associated rhomboid family serine protease